MEQNHALKIEDQINIDKWLMPRICPDYMISHGAGRVLFAGEIAGFLNPMGEGISAAMESGYHAANALINHFNNIDLIFADYKQRTKPLHDYMKRQWDLIARMTETFKEMKI